MHLDPFALAQRRRPRPDIAQDILDRLHVGNRMIELGHTGAGRMRVGIDKARYDGLAAQIHQPGARPSQPENTGVAADLNNTAILDRHGRPDRELAVDRDDLPVVQDQIGARPGRSRENGSQ